MDQNSHITKLLFYKVIMFKIIASVRTGFALIAYPWNADVKFTSGCLSHIYPRS